MNADNKTPQPIYRKDYSQPSHWIDQADLVFELDDDVTTVCSRLTIRRNQQVKPQPLVLQGEQLKLTGILVDGQALAVENYSVNAESLTLENLPDNCILDIQVEIQPQFNTSLSGLYQSSGNFCSQCEAEGFRRITYFLDRPDVMCRFSTTLTANKAKYPILLSNGNRVECEDLDDGRQTVRWEDPIPKPCYLFAVVAGDLRCHSGRFTTQSGNEIRLEIWVEPQNIDYCEHALQSLKKSMRWDEETFGLEYDLDIYMIVAVGDFNMGAMENKGLNVFNTKYVLSSPDTATDEDYENIEAVIGHEYFHNWTGNRVTCRDWFQLTLKEGLTVFRDESFTADMTSAPVKRIKDVNTLRLAQFEEDRGPMAHPIRPESYIEMNNFYTVSVYNKGAEVIRMFQTLLSKAGFRKGMDLYFKRHDGQAVTCDDFRAAMADANDVDLDQFERWYDQAGTPLLGFNGEYDADAKTYNVQLSQSQSVAGLVTDWQPWHIPVRMALLGADGADLLCMLDGIAQTEHVLELKETSQSFCFHNVNEAPIPSVLRHFSAPVKLDMPRSRAELAFLMQYDGDAFNRWDAGQNLATAVLLELIAQYQSNVANNIEALTGLVIDTAFIDGFGRLLNDTNLDGSMKSYALALPNERLLAQQVSPIDVDAIHHVRQFVMQTLARHFKAQLLALYAANHVVEYSNDKQAIHQRRLKNCVLNYLCRVNDEDSVQLASEQFEHASNMSDSEAALENLLKLNTPLCDNALNDFYTRWKDDPLVIDKWFSLQARAQGNNRLDKVLRLLEHPAFKLTNPNRFRALVISFCHLNPVHFHSADGRGYQFLADQVLCLDALNPQVAARAVAAFNQWKRYDPARQALMKARLEHIVRQPDLSKDVYEIVSRALN